ncbi:hypothetical protein BBAD15_g1525 [Beauveria bassiana D1-5]|uniref:Uncharacterized protein n=1 Tax=Beauveria bassiana D1-5 TaxID=1245745 RepID=A0A0A2VXW1_BEABA|nr:hypothetical protein BBAD15_g1525 [Beauveria bassiana D1-5]
MDDDEPMEDAEATREPQLPLSEDERQVLELYDKLQQIDLEIAIIKAQNPDRRLTGSAGCRTRGPSAGSVPVQAPKRCRRAHHDG